MNSSQGSLRHLARQPLAAYLKDLKGSGGRI